MTIGQVQYSKHVKSVDQLQFRIYRLGPSVGLAMSVEAAATGTHPGVEACFIEKAMVDFVFRGERDSRAGPEPPYQIPVGTVGTVWQESDAVPQRGPLHGKRGRWKSDSVRRAGWNESTRRAHGSMPRSLAWFDRIPLCEPQCLQVGEHCRACFRWLTAASKPQLRDQ